VAAPRSRAGLGSVLLVLVPVLALVAIRVFVAEPFAIPTSSMTPTLRPADHVLVDKLAYRFGDPRTGDLVAFHRPGTGEVLLKRVVALAGQRVGLEDGVLVVEGRAVSEPFVRDRRLIDGVYFGPVRVPSGSVFVLGDRRSDSLDSREFGAVPRADIIGRADARIWPPARMRSLR
jgi:signal peptidase I